LNLPIRKSEDQYKVLLIRISEFNSINPEIIPFIIRNSEACFSDWPIVLPLPAIVLCQYRIETNFTNNLNFTIMKKGLLYLGMMAVAMGFATSNVNAQEFDGESVTYDLSAMAILDLEGIAPTLTFAVPSEAGSAIEAVTSEASWINYTSIIEEGTTNKVSVVLSGTAVPTGTTLQVVAAAHAGTGDGTYGTPTTVVTLSQIAQDVITAVGSAYTGTGDANGHQLTYTWSVDADAYATVVAAAAADITATYTIVATGI
jgi:hypothetical protein